MYLSVVKCLNRLTSRRLCSDKLCQKLGSHLARFDRIFKSVLTFLRWCSNNRSRSIRFWWLDGSTVEYLLSNNVSKTLSFFLLLRNLHIFESKGWQGYWSLVFKNLKLYLFLEHQYQPVSSFVLTAAILVYPYLQFKYCLCTSNKNQHTLVLFNGNRFRYLMEIDFVRALQHVVHEHWKKV